MIVTPDTVLRWQRRRFREYWTSSLAARPEVAVHQAEIRALITRMATANPLWGAPRIHGELLKLGIDVAERTVSRLMPKRRPQPSQTWRTFLANHVRDLVSIDFFTVPTARLRVLFVLVVLAHHRRRVVHFNVTEHPTAVWTAQQIVAAFPDDSAPSYLLRDRDQVYGQFRHRVKGMQIRKSHGATQPLAESVRRALIGSIRASVSHSVRRTTPASNPEVLDYYHQGAPTSRSTRTHPTSGLSSFPQRARSWRFQKSAACTTATSARPRSPQPIPQGSQPRTLHEHAHPADSSPPLRTLPYGSGWSITSVVDGRSLTNPRRVGARQANPQVRQTSRTRLLRK